MPFEGDVTDAWPSCPPHRVPDRHRLAGSSPSTFTTVEVGATVRQFTGTELAPESAYIFRLPAKTRQGWASRWRPPSSPLRREVRPEAQVHCRGATGRRAGQETEPGTCRVHGFQVRPCTVACLHSLMFISQAGMSPV